jgi:hypothetical protein
MWREIAGRVREAIEHWSGSLTGLDPMKQLRFSLRRTNGIKFANHRKLIDPEIRHHRKLAMFSSMIDVKSGFGDVYHIPLRNSDGGFRNATMTIPSQKLEIELNSQENHASSCIVDLMLLID